MNAQKMKHSEIFFRRTLVITGNLKLKLGACQEELLHLKSG